MDPPAQDLGTFPGGLRGRRILLCTESFGPVNGVSRTTMMIVNHLRSHGALVAVVAPYNHTQVNTFTPVKTAQDDRMLCSEIRLTGYPLPFNPELSVVYPVRLSELYRRTFGGRPDLIYLASPASLGFQVMLQLRQQTEEEQVPVICNFQTDLAGYCEILFPSPFGELASWIFAKVQGYLFRHASVKAVFYPSFFVRRYLEDTARVQSSKLDVLRRGVSTEGFNPSKRSIELRRAWAPNGEIILFTCSRLAGEKGYGFLAQTAAELAKSDLPFKLVIVGGNRNAIVEKEVKDMFEPLMRSGTIIFTGFKVGEELMAHYASADIFLHCSITETFGLVVLEAMASGVPVIARDEGGPSDIIDHGRNGYLVPPDDLEDFVQKIANLSRRTELRRQFSEASRIHALNETWEIIGNKVAWKMIDVIQAREKSTKNIEQISSSAPVNEASAPIFTWLFMSTAARKLIASRIVDVKLTLGLFTIIGFWAGVGLYLAFTNITLWMKTQAPRVPSLRKPVLAK
ncbi:glycosyl transferase group 1 [Xylariaceae sp. FL0255]|nr:glycosyl transferase group 1 [Xylariaceae sp. FL0255]